MRKLPARAMLHLRLSRQFLSHPAQADDYDALFRDVSPVASVYWSEPGSPPSLPGHTDFDDRAYNARRRAQRAILKGRFAGGNVGYVDARDLELYSCLYRKPADMEFPQPQLLELIAREGPMNIGLMKEFSDLLVKQITPALHKLQAAFLLFEDQADSKGDRAWYLFSEEFPNIDLERYSKQEALCRVLPRFARRSVWFDLPMAQSCYRLPAKLLSAAAAQLEGEGRLLRASVCGKEGYLLPENWELLQTGPTLPTPPSVLLLQRNDFLIRCAEPCLKGRFDSPWGILYYLLIDGEIQGALVGRFTFGPPELEDIVLEAGVASRYRQEILDAVAHRFAGSGARLQRYCGVRL